LRLKISINIGRENIAALNAIGIISAKITMAGILGKQREINAL